MSSPSQPIGSSGAHASSHPAPVDDDDASVGLTLSLVSEDVDSSLLVDSPPGSPLSELESEPVTLVLVVVLGVPVVVVAAVVLPEPSIVSVESGVKHAVASTLRRERKPEFRDDRRTPSSASTREIDRSKRPRAAEADLR